jgi:ribose transport system substrate-binding protein/inositol transport system substrate-binding protein
MIRRVNPIFDCKNERKTIVTKEENLEMKTKYLFFASLLVLGLLLASCASGAPDEDQPYAFFISHQTNAFTNELTAAVKAKAEELGIVVNVYDAEKDVAKQVSQIETAVTQGVAGIVIEPVSVDGVVPALAAAKEAGIPVVVVNQRISDATAADSFVGVENFDGGVLEMQTAAEDIGGAGNVAFLLGPLGSDAQIGRTEGYYEVLKSYPDITVVFEQTANWTTDEALALTENWLQTGTELSAIVANNDGMALGALKAVEDAQMLDSIKVYGLDATPDALAAVKDGTLTATISQNTSVQGATAMETAYKLAQGEEVPEEILVDFVLITKDNVDDYL